MYTDRKTNFPDHISRNPYFCRISFLSAHHTADYKFSRVYRAPLLREGYLTYRAAEIVGAFRRRKSYIKNITSSPCYDNDGARNVSRILQRSSHGRVALSRHLIARTIAMICMQTFHLCIFRILFQLLLQFAHDTLIYHLITNLLQNWVKKI